MKSLHSYITEAAVGNVEYLEKKLYRYLDTYKASAKYSWSKNQFKYIETEILACLPVGSVITWQEHTAEHLEPKIWKIDGQNWRQDLVPSKLAGWNVSDKTLKITAGQKEDTNLTDEELRDAASSTTYKSTLEKYLRLAKSKSTKEFIQNCIDDLSCHGALE